MTRLALAHYAAAALLVLPILAHATGLAPGTEDPHVARFLAPDVIADDRSALTLDGQGVRFVGQTGGGGIVTPETIPAIPLPAPVWMLLTLLVAGWFCGRMDKRARRRRMGR